MLKRELLITGNIDYRPLRVVDTREASAFLSRRLSSSWLLSTLLKDNIQVTLLKEEGHRRLQVVAPESVVLPPVLDEDAVATMNNLVAHVGSYDTSRALDRGLVWVTARGSDSHMSLGIKPEHGLLPRELEREIDTAIERGGEFVEALLRGDPNPPYSSGYPEQLSA